MPYIKQKMKYTSHVWKSIGAFLPCQILTLIHHMYMDRVYGLGLSPTNYLAENFKKKKFGGTKRMRSDKICEGTRPSIDSPAHDEEQEDQTWKASTKACFPIHPSHKVHPFQTGHGHHNVLIYVIH